MDKDGEGKMITQDELKYLIELKKEGPTLDYKQDLELEANKDEAEFIKDVLALANSGYPSYIVTGVKDKTWESIGISKHYTQVQLNQILQYRTDPQIEVEYSEIELNDVICGIVKVLGKNPPYLVMVKDKYHSIQKGTIYIRNIDRNEGARRADLDQMFSKVDLTLGHQVKEYKVIGELASVSINFALANYNGLTAATFVRVSLQFNNIKRITNFGGWQNISWLRENIPAIQLNQDAVHVGEKIIPQGIVVEVDSSIEQIEAFAQLYSINMLPKRELYVIPLKSK
jgi:hypothetical protein